MEKTTFNYDQTIQILNHYFELDMVKKLTPAVAHGSDRVSCALGCIAEAHLCNSVTNEEARFAFEKVYNDLCDQISTAMANADRIHDNDECGPFDE